METLTVRGLVGRVPTFPGFWHYREKRAVMHLQQSASYRSTLLISFPLVQSGKARDSCQQHLILGLCRVCLWLHPRKRVLLAVRLKQTSGSAELEASHEIASKGAPLLSLLHFWRHHLCLPWVWRWLLPSWGVFFYKPTQQNTFMLCCLSSAIKTHGDSQLSWGTSVSGAKHLQSQNLCLSPYVAADFLQEVRGCLPWLTEALLLSPSSLGVLGLRSGGESASCFTLGKLPCLGGRVGRWRAGGMLSTVRSPDWPE